LYIKSEKNPALYSFFLSAMLEGMYMDEYFIVFPEGDAQEITGRLPINDIVDINGNHLPLPLPTNRMIAFRVARIKVNETKGRSETLHYLELLSAAELAAIARPGPD
jgi:hypothetical protein